jgi:hypothetical protein
MGTIFLKVRDPFNFRYSISDRGRIFVGCGKCKQAYLTIVHGFSGLKNCLWWLQNLFSNGSKI